MVVKPISKGSKIPSEEQNTASILETLPNNWLCICGDKDTYFSFLKDNKKIRGTQIDFVVINEYGVFFLEVKNVSVIKMENNNLIFQTVEQEEYNPIHRAIEYPNLAKNWFLEKLRESKLSRLYKKSNIKFGIWGAIVINNDNYVIVSPQRELKLEETTHNKQKTIIHRKEINKTLFKKIFEEKKSPYQEKLSTDDIFLIYHILMNQNIKADSVMTPELERFYEMIKYECEYQPTSKKLINEENIHTDIDKLKNEKEELTTNIIIYKQELEKEQNERKELESVLKDKSIVIKEMEKELNTINDEKEELEIDAKNHKRKSDVNFEALSRAAKSIIIQKEKRNADSKEFKKKLELNKRIKKLTLVTIPILIISIISIMVLAFFLSSELSKDPPSPSEIFNNTYQEIKRLFHRKEYSKLVETYNSLDYSFEFLTSQDVPEFRYFVAYSYFITGKDGSSIKDAGINILKDIRHHKLTINKILDIYPKVYEYLWGIKRYQEAGLILGIIEEAINDRENDMINDDEGFKNLINVKLFIMKSISLVEKQNPSQIRVTDYLNSPIKNEVGYLIEDYLEKIYTLLYMKSEFNIAKIDSSGEYPPVESTSILGDYIRLLSYVDKIQGLNLTEYEIIKNRFAELEISLYTEISIIYFFNHDSRSKALENLKEAENIFDTLDNNDTLNRSNLATYLRMFSLLARVYESSGYLCEAYEAYFKTKTLSPLPNTNLDIKIENLETEINLNETIGGMKGCRFKSLELKERFN